MNLKWNYMVACNSVLIGTLCIVILAHSHGATPKPTGWQVVSLSASRVDDITWPDLDGGDPAPLDRDKFAIIIDITLKWVPMPIVRDPIFGFEYSRSGLNGRDLLGPRGLLTSQGRQIQFFGMATKTERGYEATRVDLDKWSTSVKDPGEELVCHKYLCFLVSEKEVAWARKFEIMPLGQDIFVLDESFAVIERKKRSGGQPTEAEAAATAPPQSSPPARKKAHAEWQDDINAFRKELAIALQKLRRPASSTDVGTIEDNSRPILSPFEGQEVTWTITFVKLAERNTVEIAETLPARGDGELSGAVEDFIGFSIQMDPAAVEEWRALKPGARVSCKAQLDAIDLATRWSAQKQFAGWLPIVVLKNARPISGESKSPQHGTGTEPRLPQSEEAKIRTRDGVKLVATFYPGSKGKDTTPIICLHRYGGSRSDFRDLALLLQSRGHAVLVPDLRGHGDSTLINNVERPQTTSSMKINVNAMVDTDMEALKRFLTDKNNASELNIEKLGVIGVEMGALVALNWAYLDWSWPVVANEKQGQDVKALVLISPTLPSGGPLKMRNLTSNKVIGSHLSVLSIVGARDAKLLQETKRIHSFLRASRREPATPSPLDKSALVPLDTELQGTQVLGKRELQYERSSVEELILNYFSEHLVKPWYQWKERHLLSP